MLDPAFLAICAVVWLGFMVWHREDHVVRDLILRLGAASFAGVTFLTQF